MKEKDASMGFCASHAIHNFMTSFNANYVGEGANQSMIWLMVCIMFWLQCEQNHICSKLQQILAYS